MEQQIRHLSNIEITAANSTYEIPFSIPLPENLPSSMLYCGDLMSVFQTQYNVVASMIGLKKVAGLSLPEGQLLYEAKAIPVIRAVDPPVKHTICQTTENKVTNALGMNAGSASARAQLALDVVHQNSSA